MSKKSSSFCQLQLTCADNQEAERIAKALLNKQLVACVRAIPITSKFRWQGKIEDSQEMLMIMESRLDLFDKAEAEVAKLHSYSTFVLTATALQQISKEAEKWLITEVTNG